MVPHAKFYICKKVFFFENFDYRATLSKDAAIFTSVVEIKSADTSETDSASEETSSLPEPLTYMFDPHAANYSKDKLKEVSTKVFKQYVLENNQGFDRLTELTCQQYLNPSLEAPSLWKNHCINVP